MRSAVLKRAAERPPHPRPDSIRSRTASRARHSLPECVSAAKPAPRRCPRRRDDGFAAPVANRISCMDAWVRCRRGHVRYAGRIGRRPFAAWSRTAEGHAAVDEAAARLRVKFLARWRAARRLWRQLAAAARDEAVVVTVQSELDAFLARL